METRTLKALFIWIISFFRKKEKTNENKEETRNPTKEGINWEWFSCVESGYDFP